jgi:hypothetical protein
MCMDYTDLNKHCPKDPFPLPRIDEVVCCGESRSFWATYQPQAKRLI